MFIHHVYFWLKPDAPAEAGETLLADCRHLLSEVPGVAELRAGRPVGTARDVVDNSYAVGMSIAFANADAHDRYQDHPKHLEFIERNKAHWDRVRVYDFDG